MKQLEASRGWLWALVAVLLTSGCEAPPLPAQTANDSGTPPSEVVEAVKSELATELPVMEGITTTLHKAYAYQGYSYHDPEAGAKLVGVDVEFGDYGDGLDLDDVELLDGASNEGIGGFPHIELMSQDGQVLQGAADTEWPGAGGPLRVLLIFSVPEATNSVKLAYGGGLLTVEPTSIGNDGPSLKAPLE